jgi:hypothetical protein
MKPTATIRKTFKVREIPPAWQVELPDDPEAPVEVVITPVPQGESSPKRFLGAGKGLFTSAADVDAHIRRNRDAWGE